MKIEHVAFQVADPAAMADWYVKHLGFRVRRASDDPVVARFIADVSGAVMLEVYRNPKFPVPDYASMAPALLHVAFVCDDVPAAVARLTAAGAKLVSGPEVLGEDELAMLRDPWGLAIQLAKRKRAMVAYSLTLRREDNMHAERDRVRRPTGSPASPPAPPPAAGRCLSISLPIGCPSANTPKRYVLRPGSMRTAVSAPATPP